MEPKKFQTEDNYVPGQRLLDNSTETDLFQKPLKPKKPWYKRWWLYAYLVIFLVSLFILVAFSQITEETLNKISLDNIGSGSDFVFDEGATVIPGAVEQTDNQTTSVAETLYKAEDDPALGNPDAQIVIVEFSDFQCPFCKESSKIIKQLLTKYPDDIYYVYRDFPVSSLHDQAQLAAEAGQCAWDQNLFWPFHDLVFENQGSLSFETINSIARQVGMNMNTFSACLDNNKYSLEVIEDFQVGTNLGVIGTPTFFVNGYRITGVVPLESWEQVLDVIKFTQAPSE